MDLRTEEDVKIKYLMPKLKDLGYSESCCEFEKAIEVQEGRKIKNIFADIIVYTTPKKEIPLLLCETKSPSEVLDRRVREQAISYARLLPKIAPLVLITNGIQVHIYETINKTMLQELPSKNDLKKDLLNFLVSKDIQDALRLEAKHELFIIDDVQTFKSILKSCHNEIRNNEGYDPTVAFDEMSKVLFCKMYEEKHSGSNRFRLSVYDDTLKRLSINVVKQIFEETKKDIRYSNLFLEKTVINLQDRTIRKIVELFENCDLSLTAFDVKGESFEYFLGDTFTGGLGEFFTPRNIVEFIIEAINPKIGNKMIDPFCGTGGFLIYAFELLNEKIRLQEFSDEEKEKWRFELSNRSLYGTDWKERTSQACKMNMMVHGDGSAGIFMHHGLVNVPGSIEDGLFDICLTNPPFGSFENDPDILVKYTLGASRNSQSRLILAIERCVKLIKPNGLIGIVVIDGIINNDSTGYVRDYIKKHTFVKAVISLNKETFEGYGAKAKTSILILQKKNDINDNTKYNTFFAIAKNTGYAPNGDQIPGNELPDILYEYKSFIKGETNFKSSSCWLAQIEDRLDAEFYSTSYSNHGNYETLVQIKENASGLMSEMASKFNYINKVLSTNFNEIEYDSVELGQVLEQVIKKERVEPEKTYKLLGVRWWGGGTFLREEKLGKSIKGKSLYRVSKNLVIYNRLFAFRGSFALLPEEHDGCFVSNEFPMFKTKESVKEPLLLCRYIVHCLNTPQYLCIVDKLSTGSTKQSRNRFKEKQFLSLKIQIPKNPNDLEMVTKIIDNAVDLRFQQETLLSRFKDLQESISYIIPEPKANEVS